MFTQYKGVIRILGTYWRAYGGLRALIGSPYLHLSLLLAGASYGEWSKPGWWNTVISVEPSLLGFSLGGYAIWLAVGDERFREVLARAQSKGSESAYLRISATFAHFILFQFLALMAALMARAMYAFELDFRLTVSVIDAGEPFELIARYVKLVLSFTAYWLFVYSLCVALAATMAIFRVSTWYSKYQENRLAQRRNSDGNIP